MFRITLFYGEVDRQVPSKQSALLPELQLLVFSRLQQRDYAALCLPREFWERSIPSASRDL
jgi:hypothetical protein